VLLGCGGAAVRSLCAGVFLCPCDSGLFVYCDLVRRSSTWMELEHWKKKVPSQQTRPTNAPN
jgi:hypothetical protein